MHDILDISGLFECLNYSNSPYFYIDSRLEEVTSFSHIFRLAKKKCGLRGVYALEDRSRKCPEKTFVPMVYVCEAESEKHALDIHKFVWNQNCVPFLLVVTPKSFRLYPGFNFDTALNADGQDQHLLQVARTAKDVLEGLSDFSADSIDSGHVWDRWLQESNSEKRVDQNLLKNLEKLSWWLRKKGLDRKCAHSLIGKYVYLRYLRDRDIISDRKLIQWGVDLKSIFGRDATVEGYNGLIEKLDQWLNGGIFPFPSEGDDAPQDIHIKKIASTFLGDDMSSGQMYFDFKAYNFEHIPIETLSIVYQQFLHSEERGRSQGAYYTPLHLVNFILAELDGKLALNAGMKVLDPACGSGAFIVQCYRMLIEKEMAAKGTIKLNPLELKSLLTQSIFGIDIDEDACGVTELSLVLTLLDYVDPPDLEDERYRNFKLPALRNRNVFCCEGGLFHENSSPIKIMFEMQFDWIIGNPPWNRLTKSTNGASECAAVDWVLSNKKKYPINNMQIAEAFVWRSSELLSDKGVTGFLLPSQTLFKNQENANEFRKSFFKQMDVWCIVNFSNLRHLMFQGAHNPAAAFFYKKSKSFDDKPGSILTYAPFAINQNSHFGSSRRGRKKIWTILMNSDEMREVPYREVLSGLAAPWKMAMWGMARDTRLLNSIDKEYCSLSEFAIQHGLSICQGLEIRPSNNSNEIEPLQEIARKYKLNTKALQKSGKIFNIPKNALDILSEDMAFVRKGRGVKPLEVCYPPHIIVNAHRTFSVFSDAFIVVPARQIGIAGDQSKRDLLKALTLYLNSDFVEYQQKLSSTTWGIERGRLTQEDLQQLPVPLNHLSPKETREWVELHDELASYSENCMEDKKFLEYSSLNQKQFNQLISQVNIKVNELLKLSEEEQHHINDFIKLRMKLNDGATPSAALKYATTEDLRLYAEILKEALDDFLDADVRDQHRVSAICSPTMVLLSVEHADDQPAGPILINEVTDANLKRMLDSLESILEFELGQWIYFQKNLKIFRGRSTYFLKKRHIINWVPSQAFTDSDEFIAEKLMCN